jgi:hypothetical protein
MQCFLVLLFVRQLVPVGKPDGIVSPFAASATRSFPLRWYALP